MDSGSYAAKPQAKNLITRVDHLEIHHEETRKRIDELYSLLRRQRERMDEVLGSEPEGPSLPRDEREWNGAGR